MSAFALGHGSNGSLRPPLRCCNAIMNRNTARRKQSKTTSHPSIATALRLPERKASTSIRRRNDWIRALCALPTFDFRSRRKVRPESDSLEHDTDAPGSLSNSGHAYFMIVDGANRNANPDLLRSLVKDAVPNALDIGLRSHNGVADLQPVVLKQPTLLR